MQNVKISKGGAKQLQEVLFFPGSLQKLESGYCVWEDTVMDLLEY